MNDNNRDLYEEDLDTKEFPAVGYEDSNIDFIQEGSYRGDEYITTLEDREISRLDRNLRKGDYVASQAYRELYLDAKTFQNACDIFEKKYEDLYNDFSLEKERSATLSRELDESKRLKEAAERGHQGREQALDEREHELDRIENKSKLKRWLLYGITALLVIMLAVSIVLLFNEKGKTADVQGDSSISQQRAQELDSALQSEKTAKNNLEQKNNDLERRNEDLTKDSADKEKKISDLEGQIKQRDDQLKSLSERVDELTDVKAETITQTVPADPVTITQTAPVQTETVTQTASAHSNG